MPRGGGVSSAKAKSDRMVSDFILDISHKRVPDDVYVARITKNLGQARIEVVYSKDDKVYVKQAKIPGKFKGRGKKDVFASSGSYVLICETGVTGSLALEMVALISREELAKIQEHIELHSNLLATETDADTLMTKKLTSGTESGFEFANEEEEEEEEELNVDSI